VKKSVPNASAKMDFSIVEDFPNTFLRIHAGRGLFVAQRSSLYLYMICIAVVKRS